LTPAKRKYLNVVYYRIQIQIHRGIPRLNWDPITQVMESRNEDLGSLSEIHSKFEKMEHENGLKF